MVYKNSFLELLVNNEAVDIENYDSINIRLNNVLYNPAEINSSEAEYSFSFDLPATPKNNRIFAYANNPSAVAKFNKTYNAKLNANGIIFDGTLVVNYYEDKKYNVSLVTIRVIDYDQIFGETKMNEIDWYIPFDGAVSVNDYNSRLETDVVFPLVSYGAFQKVPKFSDDVGNDYTRKFDLDEYNRWYIETFYPSPKMLTTLKKCFEMKGFVVEGDVFNDTFLNNIYQSVNLSDEQDPLYNLGNPTFGKVSLSVSATTSGQGYEQELAFPYFKVWNPRGQFGGQYGSTATVQAWNWNTIKLYDLLEGNVQVKQSKCYMYQPNEHVIVIPADGFYKFDLDIKSIRQTTTNLTVGQSMLNSSGNDIEVNDVTFSSDLREQTPFELHIVRNYDDDIELIKGKHNKKYTNGNPTQTIYNQKSNITEWDTVYPHEDPYNSVLPTEKNNLTFRNTIGNFRGASTQGQDYSVIGGSRSGNSSDTGFGGRRGGGTTARTYSSTSYGYMPENMGELMMYDPAVSPHFICGASTFMGGTPAVMKNGKSWSASNSDIMRDFYTEDGYIRLYNESGSTKSAQTEFNKNNYPDSPTNTFTSNKNSASGRVTCMIYLNKNDVIQVFGVQRAYEKKDGSDVNYSTQVSFDLDITAASPKKYEILKSSNYGYNTPSDFDTKLRIGNFFNQDTEIKEYVTGIINAFNFDVRQNGNVISINKKTKFPNNAGGLITIDNKVNTNDARIMPIDFPKSVAVRYKIDTDEYGFECSVPRDKINLDDWQNYGDSGYTVINLSEKEGATDKYLDLPFSYTWYVPFYWYNVNSADTKVSSARTTINLPCISKSEYMLDGYDYSDSLQHDGYGLSQRFWFKPKQTTCNVWLDVYPQESVTIYQPSNLYTNYRDIYFNLSYKTTENSLLDYFSICKNIDSNYVEIEAYLTNEEYTLLKSGARVVFDSDVYYVSNIEGHDPSQANPTKLKLIKKVK